MIRFINKDGNGFSTEIENAETGENLAKLLAISHGAKIILGQQVIAEVEPFFAAADITASKTNWVTKHPLMDSWLPLAAMEFRDGTRVEFAEDGTPSIKTSA